MDHHFAERQIGHVHLSFGDSLTGHSHFYQESQAHSHAPDHTFDAMHPSTGERTVLMEVVFLTADDGAGATFAVLFGPTSDREFSTPDSGDSALLLAYSRREALHLGVHVPPPKRPPPP